MNDVYNILLINEFGFNYRGANECGVDVLHLEPATDVSGYARGRSVFLPSSFLRHTENKWPGGD